MTDKKKGPLIHLEMILDTLGWQGGTIHQVLEEIRRLRRLAVVLATLHDTIATVHDEIEALRAQGMKAQTDRLLSRPEKPEPVVGDVIYQCQDASCRKTQRGSVTGTDAFCKACGHIMFTVEERHLIEYVEASRSFRSMCHVRTGAQGASSSMLAPGTDRERATCPECIDVWNGIPRG